MRPWKGLHEVFPNPLFSLCVLYHTPLSSCSLSSNVPLYHTPCLLFLFHPMYHSITPPSLLFIFHPMYLVLSPPVFSLSLLVVAQIRGHIYSGLSFPLPITIRAFHRYREKAYALSSLVDSRRIEQIGSETHSRGRVYLACDTAKQPSLRGTKSDSRGTHEVSSVNTISGR